MPIPQGFPEFEYQEPIKRTPPIPEAFKAPISPPITQPVEVIRIYPKPINPPTSPSATPKPPTPRTKPFSGGRIAGTFRMPTGATTIARVGSGRLLGRLIPGIGHALLAYDSYQLACYFGLLPGSICPRPDNPQPGGTSATFTGGQCDGVLYDVTFEVSTSSSRGECFLNNQPKAVRTFRVWGPFRGAFIRTFPSITAWNLVMNCRGANGDGQVNYGAPQPQGDYTMSLGGSSPTCYDTYSVVVLSVARADKALDNCGNVPIQPNPQQPPSEITNINTNIRINLPKILPPRPFPRRSPIIINPPNPIPDINITFDQGGSDNDTTINIDLNFNPKPTINFGDQINIDFDFPPFSQPTINLPAPVPLAPPPPAPAPIPPPRRELPPPLPDTLPPDASDSDKYNFRLGREILDKLYRANSEIVDIQNILEKQNKVLDNLQKLIDFEVEGSQLIKRCDDIEIFYSYKDKVLRAINKQLDHVKQIEQTVIDEVCNVEKESLLAVPDYWQVQLMRHPPQVAVVYRRFGYRDYYRLCIPHPLSTNKPTQSPLPEYIKGRWQGMIVCIDNSKFVVNAETPQEATRICNVALTLIDPDFLDSDPRIYISERKGGTPVSIDRMIPRAAMYFPQGVKNVVPEWRVAFKANDPIGQFG